MPIEVNQARRANWGWFQKDWPSHGATSAPGNPQRLVTAKHGKQKAVGVTTYTGKPTGQSLKSVPAQHQLKLCRESV